jgi:hypothetical protein
MKILDFFKTFFKETTLGNRVKTEGYLPSFWEDDYCQIEIVPFENREFILKTSEQINDLANNSKTEFGFTNTFGRGQMPVTTLSKEIRTDYLETLLTGFKFEKAKSIKYDSHKTLDCQTGSTKAY